MFTSKHLLRFVAALSLMGLLLAACNKDDEPETVDLGAGIVVTGVPRTTICHFTGSAVLPYVEIAISDEAIERHRSHDGDLIPAPASGCPEVSGIAETDETTEPGATARPTSASATNQPQVKPTQTGLCSTDDQSIADFISQDERFSRLEALMNETGVLPVLDDGIRLTLFAPTDDAFNSADQNDLNEWLGDSGSRNALALYHVAEDQWDTDELDDLETLTTISGEDIRIKTVDDEFVLNDDTRITEPDIALCNGMVQVIDDLLVPPIFDDTPDITATPESTRTPQPTATREPTDTPRPQQPTPIPTRTPLPPEPTSTRIPTRTPLPTDQPEATDAPPTATDEPEPTDEPPTDAPTDEPTSESGGSASVTATPKGKDKDK